jgi:hypothetical protein
MLHVWTRAQPFGAELADIAISGDNWSAAGVAIGIQPLAYRLEYELTTVEDYVTARLVVRAQGEGWRRALALERGASGAWSCTTESVGGDDLPAPGGDLTAVAGALDCDLAWSPLTNSMPVLRHRLHERGGPIDFLMAWVSVPDLAVHPSGQRYTFIRRGAGASVVRFESLDSTFSADVSFDDAGVVLDYPGIGRRVA